jgi:DNA polymerase-3 subunit delta
VPAKKTTSPVHFVSGSDEAAVKRAAAELAAKLAPGADAFGLETIDGAVETVDPSISRIRETTQALSTLPFLGGTKLVWLKSAAFLADTVAGRSEAVLQELEHLCDLVEGGLPEGVIFLMSAPEADKRRSAYKRLSKAGNTTLCDKPSLGFGAGEEDVVTWTAQQLRSRGLKISHDAVEMLAARVGLETGQLHSEIDKLETALGAGHEIAAEDIRALVPATRESGVFDLGNAISARNLPLALETLEHLFHQGEKGVGILLASIVPTVRNLLLAKSLLVRHKLRAPVEPNYFARDLSRLPPHETDHLPRKKDGTLNSYGLGLAAKHSVHYTLEELQRGFHGCAEANQKLITSQGSESVILTRLLVSFMQRPVGKK